MRSFVDIEARSAAGTVVNEDAFGSTLDTLVAVDGATGLAGVRRTPFGSDAQWFSSRLARAVVEHAARPVSMHEVLVRALDDCADELNSMGVADRADLPSGSVAFARCGDETLEVLSLGDCTTVVSMFDGSTAVLTDAAVGRLDSAIVNSAVRIARRDETTVRQALPLLTAEMQANRDLRNTPAGYWIADPQGLGAAHATLHRFPIDKVAEVVLMSDGFAAVHAVTAQCGSWPELAERLARGEGAQLLSVLVDALDGDPDLMRYPRLKIRDDATFIRGRMTSF